MKALRSSNQTDKATEKKADKKVTFQPRKPKSRVTVEQNTSDDISPQEYNDGYGGYGGYVVPAGETALVQFPFKKGTGHIWISRMAGGELSILPAPHCTWHIELTVFDTSGVPRTYARKVKD